MKRQSKFNVSKSHADREYDGIVFDSALEMRYYRDVLLEKLKTGEITHWERQKKYVLQEKFEHNGKTVLPVDYKADFYVEYKNGIKQVIDIKGFADAVALLKRKLFWHRYPDLDYVWIGYSRADGGWVSYETILDGRKQRKKERKQKENKE